MTHTACSQFLKCMIVISLVCQSQNSNSSSSAFSKTLLTRLRQREKDNMKRNKGITCFRMPWAKHSNNVFNTISRSILISTGATLFHELGRRGWVPIQPITAFWATLGTQGEWLDHTWKQIPLRLSWAWTIWKAQGQTIPDKLVLDIGEQEKEHGLTYTAFSRATDVANIGITNPLTRARLTSKIKNGKKLKRRVEEERRLEALEHETQRKMQNMPNWRDLVSNSLGN